MGALKTMILVLAWALVIAATALCAQEPPNNSLLFRQLQSPVKTDEATKELLQLGKSNAAVRKYLASHLPAMIEKGPQKSSQPWMNAVRLAGDLKIAEAAPALVRWIALNTGGTVTLAQEARLEVNPAAHALAEIGEPAIPSVARVLGSGNLAERQVAFYVLNQLGSPKSRSVLSQHLKRESDPQLRKLIEKALT